MSEYAIRVSPSARRSLLALADAAYARVSEMIESLDKHPYLGQAHEPTYEAAQLPFSCRVCYVRAYGIYYSVIEEGREVYIRFLEDQRMDPRLRFTGRLG